MASGASHSAGSFPSTPRLPPIAYEREPGAASSAPRASYQRREPEKTVFYRVVLDNVETLFEEARSSSEDGSGYPKFAEKAMRHYLSCGILAHGFARLRCPDCGFERVVAYSCKSAFCPSCRARRAAQIAAHLVDRVLPEASYRQFVLTFPWPMRLPLAFDPSFLSKTLNAYLAALLAWQRRRGRLVGIRGGRTGAITFIQRFGGALNLESRAQYLALSPPLFYWKNSVCSADVSPSTSRPVRFKRATIARTRSLSRSARRISHGANGTICCIGSTPASTSFLIVVSLVSV